MKKIILGLALLFSVSNSFSQSTAGLIAHWDMNGTPNDVSGNGHNGHANNVTLDTGMDGVYGHAYYFNGVNSYISVPYSPAFNVSGYSICAKVKVSGFYSGTCHGNMILVRGKTGLGNCVYSLLFGDVANTAGCSGPVDTTQEIFLSGSSAPSATLSPASSLSFVYTPSILERHWYSVVATFNDTTYKLYVDGILKDTATITNIGLPMGTGTDSISIGYALLEASSGYPYPLNGTLDDVVLYNRPLSDTEVLHYNDSCGTITQQPRTSSTHIGGNSIYTVHTTVPAASFQWQQDIGTGFVNLTNSGIYSGVNTDTLHITGVTIGVSGAHYRCLVYNSAGCNDTTTSALLTLGIENVNLSNSIIFYPNPVVSNLNFVFHKQSISGSLRIFNLLGQELLYKEISVNTGFVDLTSFKSGQYFGIFESGEERSIVRIIKAK